MTGARGPRIAGLGCDVVALAAFRRQINSPVGPRFLANVLTPGEIDRCAGDLAAFAAHWAAKEAIAKAIGSGWTDMRPRQIDLTAPDLYRDSPKWLVERSDDKPWPRDAQLWTWHISTSHTSQHSTAVAIATHEPPVTGRDAGDTKALRQDADSSPHTASHPSRRHGHGRQWAPHTEGTTE